MFRILTGRFLIYLLLLWVCDMTLTAIFRVGPVKPVLMYLLVLYAAYQWGWQKSLPVAAAVGLLRDLTGMLPLGIETSSILIATMLLDFLVRKLERGIWLLRIIISFLYVLSALIVQYSFALFFTRGLSLSLHSVMILTGSAAYSALLVPVFFYISSRWFGERRQWKQQYELFS